MLQAPIRDHALLSDCQSAALRGRLPGTLPQAISHVGPVDAASALTEAREHQEAAACALVVRDGPSTGLRPVAACGTSPRREE